MEDRIKKVLADAAGLIEERGLATGGFRHPNKPAGPIPLIAAIHQAAEDVPQSLWVAEKATEEIRKATKFWSVLEWAGAVGQEAVVAKLREMAS